MSDFNTRNHLFDTLSTVDGWSQLACLGSMAFTVTAEAIRKAMRLIPDHPTPDTVDAFLNEERNLKLDVEYAGPDKDGVLVPRTSVNDVNTTPGNYHEERRELSALLELRQYILDLSEEVAANTKGASHQERTLLNTLEFMRSQQRFDPVQAARQYNALMKLGAKNYGQTRAQYVEEQKRRAAREAEGFVAKGEHAVQLLEGLDLIEGDVGERVWNQLYARCVQKLIERRQKIGMTLTWRTDATQRADAEADITFIEAAIVALDGEVPAEAIAPPEAEEDVVQETAPAAPTVDMVTMMQAFMSALQQQQSNVAGPTRTSAYRVPGPVTVSR